MTIPTGLSVQIFIHCDSLPFVRDLVLLRLGQITLAILGPSSSAVFVDWVCRWDGPRACA